jgi:hypothetical protein
LKINKIVVVEKKFNKYYEVLGDRKAAELQMYNMAMQNFADQVNLIKAKSSNPQLRLKAEQTLATVDKNIKAADLAIQQQLLNQQMAAQANQVFDAVQRKMIPIKSEKDKELYVPGFGVAYNLEASKKANELASQAITAKEQLKELIQIAETPTIGKHMPNTEIKQKGEILAKTLAGALRVQLIGPGAVSKAEWDILNSIIQNPTEFGNIIKNPPAALKTLYGQVNDSMNNQMIQFIAMPTSPDFLQSLNKKAVKDTLTPATYGTKGK